MANQACKKFTWVIKNFSSLQTEWCSSTPILIGDYKWCLTVFPKGYDYDDHLSLYLDVVDVESLPSGWRTGVKLKLILVNQVSEKLSIVKETYCRFDQCSLSLGYTNMIPLTKLNDKKEKFLEEDELMIAAEVDVLEVIDTSEDTEEATEIMVSEMKQDDIGEKYVLISKNQEVEESIDVNGFQVLPSQVESAKRIFERHPEIAVEFRAKNQYLRTACMSFLLSLIETLCQSPEKLSNEDLVEADIALTYVKGAGFKVDWLEIKLDQVKKQKEKEQSSLARLHEIEEHMLKLKLKWLEMDDLAEKEEAELLATRTPLSFNDLV